MFYLASNNNNNTNNNGDNSTYIKQKKNYFILKECHGIVQIIILLKGLALCPPSRVFHSPFRQANEYQETSLCLASGCAEVIQTQPLLKTSSSLLWVCKPFTKQLKTQNRCSKNKQRGEGLHRGMRLKWDLGRRENWDGWTKGRRGFQAKGRI